MSTLVVNLFAGAGAGKSTTMADVFRQLKGAGINCEMAPEFIKEAVWEGRDKVPLNQPYILGKQYFRISRLINEVDVVITDSPILLSLAYKDETLKPSFDACVYDLFNSFDNMNYYINRVKPYNPKGRYQDEAGAREKDKDIEQLLIDYKIPYITVDGDTFGAELIFEEVRFKLEQIKILNSIDK